MTTVVLVHGWGYDASLWNAVREQLDPAITVAAVDFGYFGAAGEREIGDRPRFLGSQNRGLSPISPISLHEPVIAVGHSLGVLWWLTQAEIPWRRLLSINGFPRFTAADGYPGVAPRVLMRMQAQFARDPAAVLTDFHARCGGHAPTAAPDTAQLAAGLEVLAQRDGRAMLAARRADVSALACDADPIVPQVMSLESFGTQCELVASAGHLLPVTHAELCARRIGALAE